MSRRLFSLIGALAVTLACASYTFAQNTQSTTTVTTQKTEAVQNADGTWSVIEYPANKEVIVNLTPTDLIPGATGTAKIMRMSDHTMINLNASGLNTTGLNLYAVDPLGKVTLLGPINAANGVATQSFTTPLDKFMLVLSPEGNLTTYSPTTRVAFRSAAPEGFAVVPYAQSGRQDGAPIGERVAATTTTGPATPYTAPMLGVSNMRRGTDTHIRVNFAGAMTGSRANVFLEPRKDGPTTIKMRFHEMKDAPAGKIYVVWAVSPDNKFVKLGQVVNTGNRNEAQIQTETALREFGLLVTMEDETTSPTGPVVGTVIIDNK
ncbi:MAG TPA: anti-sigma factor [Pyrinomonadaceae bacterium]|jgi:hypothetical protein|nr:anti-sigma factor [Pyrinomonadaceae bacterium]